MHRKTGHLFVFVSIYLMSYVVLNFIGVYLPCHDSTTDTMDLYLQTLDLVQSILDTCDAPTDIMGDFNATLPEEVTLVNNWYCKKPYKRRSGVLYDFFLIMKCVLPIFYSHKIFVIRLECKRKFLH